ncbi:MAG: MTH1187 family thiamine-binding protein [Halorhabdus sp.]
MTAFGFLSVAPVIEGSMSGEVAKAVAAIEDHDVGYETTPMGTIIEAETAADIFDAAADAHAAVDADRVETFLKIDDKRAVEQAAEQKVDAVADELGHDPQRDLDA